jgi:hypothetical protein
MGRIDTRGYSAKMIEFFVGGTWKAPVSEGYPMSSMQPPALPEYSVPQFVFSPNPEPATFGNLNFSHKSLQRFGIHD